MQQSTIEPIRKEILRINISIKRNMFVAKKYISSLIKIYGKHPVSTSDGRKCYLQACNFLEVKHNLHS
jgi:transposase-like protein